LVFVLVHELQNLNRVDLTIVPPVDGVHDGCIVSFSPDAATSNDLIDLQKLAGGDMSDLEVAARMLVAFGVEWNLTRYIPAEDPAKPVYVDSRGEKWQAGEDGKPITEPVPVNVESILNALGARTLGKIAEAVNEAINPKA
jgi:hypothetical protein